jgi:hypothetical protein
MARSGFTRIDARCTMFAWRTALAAVYPCVLWMRLTYLAPCSYALYSAPACSMRSTLALYSDGLALCPLQVCDKGDGRAKTKVLL